MKIVYRVFIVLTVLLLGAGLFLGHAMKGMGPKTTAREETVTTTTEQTEEEAPEIARSNAFHGDDFLQILLVGIDRTAMTGQKHGDEVSRSDTLMLATLDPVTKRAQLLSIPRDTYVNVPGHGKTKINHAYMHGKYPLLKKTVERFLDVKIDHYAIVDYDAVRELTTAVGGVEVYLPINYKYTDPSVDPPLEINFHAGYQLVEGDDAVRFLRIRKIFDDQDIGRIGQQQKFLKSLFKKMKTPGMLLKLPTLLNIINKDVETDLSYGEMADLAYFGIGMDFSNLETEVLEGGGQRIDGLDYWIVNQRYAQGLVEKFKDSCLEQRKHMENMTEVEGQSTASDDEGQESTGNDNTQNDNQ